MLLLHKVYGLQVTSRHYRSKYINQHSSLNRPDFKVFL